MEGWLVGWKVGWIGWLRGKLADYVVGQSSDLLEFAGGACHVGGIDSVGLVGLLMG